MRGHGHWPSAARLLSSIATIDRVLKETRRYEEISRENAAPLHVSAAYDGMEIDW